jgi:hypothetical protein
MLPERLLFRTAGHLRAGWETSLQSPELGQSLERLARDYLALQAARARLVKATRHGLSLILPTLEKELLSCVEGLQQTLAQVQPLLQERPREYPSIASLAADLRQLEEEFVEVKIHGKQKAISVTTGPINLEGIKLGPFAIKLCWGRHRDGWSSDRFDIIALDPNPASSDESVTHPHVKDETICAGEASAAIRKALQQGRLADACLMVRSVLTTYNRHSVHVSLDAWNGRECSDCATCLSEDEVWFCDRCDEEFCRDCVDECNGCHGYRCSGCIGRCLVCKGPFCEKCLRASAHSNRRCCCSCSTPCPNCRHLVAKDELDRGCRAGPQAHPNIRMENADETDNPVSAGVP